MTYSVHYLCSCRNIGVLRDSDGKEIYNWWVPGSEEYEVNGFDLSTKSCYFISYSEENKIKEFNSIEEFLLDNFEDVL